MAQAIIVAPNAPQQWPQGDARDPLGIWAGRDIIGGDGGGGGIKVTFQIPAGLNAAYVYTCYSATVADVTSSTGVVVKCRLLTNWPDADPQAGVQAFATLKVLTMNGSTTEFTAPFAGPVDNLIGPNDRFLLLYDPRPVTGNLDIVELELAENQAGESYSFEAYGYFWDRGVLQAPGGPRHPGSA